MRIEHIAASLETLSALLCDSNNSMQVEQVNALGETLAGILLDLMEVIHKSDSSIQQLEDRLD
ncbi:hypothetical protein HG263_05500 [Pseudoalteromonas sp. JBTF-M23]|uniref:Uncharacterized protein n=1 Tax=Pseudoalteromonas caenipelagi TaxID=2726988 RepID=A0A849VE64_9GAMM|nr:hypothetical protein [Pseudoalteromonas caenipelagi]NOU49991.1 hypothetical protein [Pseudoalteromonas caenipelagi]